MWIETEYDFCTTEGVYYETCIIDRCIDVWITGVRRRIPSEVHEHKRIEHA
ncbi:hypothetical protein D3C87_1318280 [compost metagenome]